MIARKELLDKIRLGEATFLELKEVRFAGGEVRGPRRDNLADELAAFANSRGGVCLLGVADALREIVGIPVDRLDTVVRFAREICTDSIEPPLNPVIDPLWLPATTGEELAVIKIDVPPSLFVHRSPGGYLHRVGDQKRAMSAEYLSRLFQQRSQTGIIRFDEQTVPGANLDDLSPDLWKRFRTPRTGDTRDDLLTKLRLARPDESDILKPTVAGVLMATSDPRQWFPNAYIQAVALPWKPDPAGSVGGSVSTGRRRHFRSVGHASRQCLSFRLQEHEDCCLQASGAQGPTPVRHDGRVRGRRQRGCPPRLFDLRIQDPVAAFR